MTHPGQDPEPVPVIGPLLGFLGQLGG